VHGVCDARGNLVNGCFTTASVHDNQQAESLTEGLSGLFLFQQFGEKRQRLPVNSILVLDALFEVIDRGLVRCSARINLIYAPIEDFNAVFFLRCLYHEAFFNILADGMIGVIVQRGIDFAKQLMRVCFVMRHLLKIFIK